MSPPTTATAAMKNNHWREYERRYGPYGFGVVSLLVVWIYVVAPELKSSRHDANIMLQAAEQQKAVADSLRDTGRVLERSSDQLRIAAETNREVAAMLKATIDKAQILIDNRRP